MTISTTIISLIIALISVIFAILTFARNKGKDNNEINARLVKIETDIVYIRESISRRETWEAKREDWERDIESRVNNLERK